MAALSTSTFAYALKRLYPSDKVRNMVYKNNPLLGMIPKWEKFVGANFSEVVAYKDTLGRSASFSYASSLMSPSVGVAFLLTRVKNYSLFNLDSETIFASEGNEGALLQATQREMDAALNALSRSIAIDLYGDGSGQIGTISTSQSTVDTTVITLSNAEDVTKFEVGMKLNVAANTASALRDAGTLTVSIVNRDAGTVTCSAKINTITGLATGDAIFPYGDYTTTSDRLKVSGLAAWLPYTSPSASESYFGVDRSVDPSRLAGIRVDGTGLPLQEALIKLATRIGREGGTPDHCFLSFGNWESLINQIGTKVQYTSKEVAGVGFPGVSIFGPKGEIKVFPDQNCPGNRIYMLTLDSFKLRSLGPVPRILDLDGGKLSREASTDSWECRCAFYGNCSTSAPGWNGVLAV